MTRARAIIHLGPIKTGTTALSRYFTLTNRAGTTPKHIIYPMGELWFGEDGYIVRQRNQLEQLLDARLHDFGEPETASRPGSELDRALAGVAAAARARGVAEVTAVFVVETGLPRFRPALINEIFTRHFDDVDFVFMARRQDKLVASIVSQNVKMWNRMWSTINPRFEMTRFPRDRDFAALDYAKQFSRWASVVGPEHMIVIPYDEGNQGSFAMIDRFFDFTGLGKAPRVEGIEGRRIHPTFSDQGMNRLAHIKSIARWTYWIPAFQQRIDEVWKRSTEVYYERALSGSANPDGSPFVSWTLSPNDRRWVLRRYRDSNKAVRALTHDHADVWDAWLADVEEAAR